VVNATTGEVVRVASGFTNPLAVLADNNAGRLLIADYGDSVSTLFSAFRNTR
jgi:hypothetical protein